MRPTQAPPDSRPSAGPADARRAALTVQGPAPYHQSLLLHTHMHPDTHTRVHIHMCMHRHAHICTHRNTHAHFPLGLLLWRTLTDTSGMGRDPGSWPRLDSHAGQWLCPVGVTCSFLLHNSAPRVFPHTDSQPRRPWLDCPLPSCLLQTHTPERSPGDLRSSPPAAGGPPGRAAIIPADRGMPLKTTLPPVTLAWSPQG